LRGIRFLQVPTTLLAVIDSSVGGKTGVNSEFGKNLIGTFHQPAGVLIDPIVLRTLEGREITAGLSEAVKHSALAGGRLFEQTFRVIEAFELSSSDATEALESETFLAAQIAFKAKIVAGDEREAASKSDPRSRKILNFGHTFAHALENATNYRYFKHGEAVGYGILFAAELSKKLELLPQSELNLLYDVVHRVGVLPPIDGIGREAVLTAMRRDKKTHGDGVQWILLNGIGKPCIVPQSKIPDRTFQSVLRKFLPKK
jgi:3-dehydroquinate synthase